MEENMSLLFPPYLAHLEFFLTFPASSNWVVENKFPIRIQMQYARQEFDPPEEWSRKERNEVSTLN